MTARRFIDGLPEGGLPTLEQRVARLETRLQEVLEIIRRRRRDGSQKPSAWALEEFELGECRTYPPGDDAEVTRNRIMCAAREARLRDGWQFTSSIRANGVRVTRVA